MTCTFEILKKDQYLQIRYDGRKNMDNALALWSDCAKACEESGCYRILGVANTTEPLSLVEAYTYPELFEKLGIDQRFRIAWVELNSEAYLTTFFVERAVVHHGLSVRVFVDLEDARNWLLDEPAIQQASMSH